MKHERQSHYDVHHMLSRVKQIWRGIEGVHTAVWLYSLLPAGALTIFGVFWENLPITYAVAAGIVAAGGLAAFISQVRTWAKSEFAKDVNVEPEANVGSAAVTLPTLAVGEANSNYFKNRDILIRELVVDEFRVIGRTFEDCVIHGPAIVGFLRCILDKDCVFVAPTVEAVFIPIWPRRGIVGSLLVKDCIFRRCKFRQIGVIDIREPQSPEY